MVTDEKKLVATWLLKELESKGLISSEECSAVITVYFAELEKLAQVMGAETDAVTISFTLRNYV